MYYLLDVSWLLYRGYYALSNVYDDRAELHFLCKKLESILSNKSSTVCLCLDGYNTKGRRILGEQYKAGRHQEGIYYNVYEGLSSFIDLLNNERIKVYYNPDYESDEIIFTLSRLLDGRKKILSGDKDLLQSLNNDTVIESFKGLVTTSESYKFEYADKFFEIEPERLPIFRAIAGDASDTLKPPVARFPRKLAAKIAKDVEYNGVCPTIEQLNSLAVNYKDSEKRWVIKLIDAFKSFSINFDIMKLNVIEDPLNCDYKYQKIELSDNLKSKILKLNTL